VLQFEGNSNQQAWLTVRWTVIDRNKKILVGQRSQLNRRAGSPSTEDFVKALSETLGALSREIVKTLLSFEKQGTTSRWLFRNLTRFHRETDDSSEILKSLTYGLNLSKQEINETPFIPRGTL